MKVHIQRWHKGTEQPRYIDDQAVPLSEDKKDLYAKESSASMRNSVNHNLFPDPFSELVNETYGRVMEAKEISRNIEEIDRFFNGNFYRSTQLFTNNSMGNIALANSRKPVVPSIPFPAFRANLSSSSTRFAPTINPQETKKEEIAGFKGKVCETCMEIVIETQYRVDESGKSPEVVTKNNHNCFVSERSPEPLTLEMKARLVNDHLAKSVLLPFELREAVKKWTRQDGQNNAYLVTFKMPINIVKANIIDAHDIHDIHTLPSRDRIAIISIMAIIILTRTIMVKEHMNGLCEP